MISISQEMLSSFLFASLKIFNVLGSMTMTSFLGILNFGRNEVFQLVLPIRKPTRVLTQKRGEQRLSNSTKSIRNLEIWGLFI